jgi:hypothetical protein
MPIFGVVVAGRPTVVKSNMKFLRYLFRSNAVSVYSPGHRQHAPAATADLITFPSPGWALAA